MTWVLLRGLMREKRHWGDFLAAFKAAFPNDQVITIDFPGNGELHQQTSASNIENMVEFARRQVRGANAKSPIRLLAISLGAMVAVAWARGYPQEIARMVLINTSLAPHNPFYHRLRPGNYPRLLTTMLFGNVQQREQLVFDLTSSQKATSMTHTAVQNWVSYARQYPISRGNIIRQLLAALRYHAPQQTPHSAMLLLVGDGDQLVNPQCSKTLANLWHCPLTIHPTAGHDLPFDDGDWVISQIQAWLPTIEIRTQNAIPR
ncbi:alpha/beta fold hydrolase [Undibacterium sp. Dicai25W]|uniref:alpha/beta fold hydrolase n=1 Tax=Undibacterium sp. Dicai25W TaxID=3413034 RepID=UPI003BF452A1